MPRPYEAVYVFDSTLEDSAVTEKLDRFHQLLGTTGEMKIDHWGRRQLAYPIGPRENGYYVVARFDAGDTLIYFRRRTANNFALDPNTGGIILVPFTTPAKTTHNFQFSAGVGFRF